MGTLRTVEDFQKSCINVLSTMTMLVNIEDIKKVGASGGIYIKIMLFQYFENAHGLFSKFCTNFENIDVSETDHPALT